MQHVSSPPKWVFSPPLPEVSTRSTDLSIPASSCAPSSFAHPTPFVFWPQPPFLPFLFSVRLRVAHAFSLGLVLPITFAK